MIFQSVNVGRGFMVAICKYSRLSYEGSRHAGGAVDLEQRKRAFGRAAYLANTERRRLEGVDPAVPMSNIGGTDSQGGSRE